MPTPASAAPPSPLPSPTIAGSRLSPRRCVWAGDAVGVPPHPSTFVCVFPPFSEVLWRHAAPARCIAPAWCLLLRSSSATLFLVRCRVALCSPGFLIRIFFSWLCVLPSAFSCVTGGDELMPPPPPTCACFNPVPCVVVCGRVCFRAPSLPDCPRRARPPSSLSRFRAAAAGQ